MLDFARNIVKVPSRLLHHITKYLKDFKRLLKEYCYTKCNYFFVGNKRFKIALLHFEVLVLTVRGKATTNGKHTIRITKTNAIYSAVRIFHSWLRVCSVQCQNICPFKSTKCLCSGISTQIHDSVFLPRSCRSVAYDYLNQLVAAFRACLNYTPSFLYVIIFKHVFKSWRKMNWFRSPVYTSTDTQASQEAKPEKVSCFCRLYQNIKLGAIRRNRRGYHYLAEHREGKRRSNRTYDE